MFTMSAGEPPKFVAAVREMDRVISGLPPLPRSGDGESRAPRHGAGAASGAAPAEGLRGTSRGAA